MKAEILLGANMLQGLQTAGEPIHLLSDIHKTGNNNVEDLLDDGKMKLSNDSD